MPFSRIAENRIREAVAQGLFENLPNAGQPLNLEEYFSTPEDLRMAYSILQSANCAPAEVELASEIARLERALAQSEDTTTRKTLQRALTDRQTQLAVMLEQRSRRSRT
jgi:2-succinyl-5-enolpyruvyl-6-hydroxy-3-cyclohexene-1-carboxylate synthase